MEELDGLGCRAGPERGRDQLLAYKDIKVIGTRWVHTDKNAKQRKSGADVAMAAKSRIVVQGCQEDESAGFIRSDSPTGSLLVFNLICSISALKKWLLRSADASTAYLQAKGIERLLVLRVPNPPPPGLHRGQLMRARGSIYGTKDAGRAWWLYLRTHLLELGWAESRIEPAFFVLKEGVRGRQMLAGVMMSRVDDVFTCGSGKVYETTIQELEVRIRLTIKTGSFTYCGKQVQQNDDYSILIDQTEAIKNLEYIVLDRSRRTKPNLPLNPEEISLLRSANGSLGWIVRQTRIDMAIYASVAAQAVGNPHIRDVIALNKAIKMIKDEASTQIVFRSFDERHFSFEQAEIFCCVDSSFGNIDDAQLGERTKSQSGYVLGLCSSGVGEFADAGFVHVLEGHTGAIKRVCRSTLAAESNGFLIGAEAAEYLRMILLELDTHDFKIGRIDPIAEGRHTHVFTDAGGLQAALSKEGGLPADKRIRILLAQIRELIGNSSDPSAVTTHWIDTMMMLADPMTKVGADRSLLTQALTTNTWTPKPSIEAIEAKAQVQQGRHNRAEAKRTAKLNTITETDATEQLD